MEKIKWKSLATYSDIKFELFEGVAKITINRPEVYNAFRPETNNQMLEAMEVCRERNDIDIVVFTGTGDKAFCSGGDQNVKGVGGYVGKMVYPFKCLGFTQTHQRTTQACDCHGQRICNRGWTRFTCGL